MNRYSVIRNKEEDLWDIYDNVRGDRLMGSFTSEAAANNVVDRKNKSGEAAKSAQIGYSKYTGPIRSVKNSAYRTPKLDISVSDGMVVIRYE